MPDSWSLDGFLSAGCEFGGDSAHSAVFASNRSIWAAMRDKRSREGRAASVVGIDQAFRPLR
ncbi:hypothetical protein L6Q85_05690 [bacterium]|nr:hypothetical protein [bacterium]